MTRTNVPSRNDSPTVVLVHGALTDASVWNGVTRQLQSQGTDVLVPALPMRGLDSDATYLAGFLGRATGPVVLVAHSYAGAVISHPKVAAAADIRSVVYVAAFQPDEGEAAGELNARFPGSLLTADNLEVRPNPLGGDDLILRSHRFAEVYAADVEPEHASVMAVSQHPMDPAALGETLPGRPTWRTVPSWALVSTADRSLPPAILRFMAERAGSHIMEVEASHAVPVAHPDAVARLVGQAVAAASSQ
jgi:pimeloyl-ACP methyl ester carboxylesterase